MNLTLNVSIQRFTPTESNCPNFYIYAYDESSFVDLRAAVQ